jgi:hypothetical protein
VFDISTEMSKLLLEQGMLSGMRCHVHFWIDMFYDGLERRNPINVLVLVSKSGIKLRVLVRVMPLMRMDQTLYDAVQVLNLSGSWVSIADQCRIDSGRQGLLDRWLGCRSWRRWKHERWKHQRRHLRSSGSSICLGGCRLDWTVSFPVPVS